MKVTFMCPSAPHPVGGVIAVFGFANGLRRRGHEVYLVHLPMWDSVVERLDQISWHEFEPGIDHYFPGGEDRRIVPDADIVFGVGALVNLGLPVSLVQGIMTFQPELERAVFRAPCLKVCVSGWLVDVGRALGVPADQLVHVPMGIDHGCFRERVPFEQRPRRVGMLYGSHPAKGWSLGLESLRILRERLPDVDVVAFGTEPPADELPSWVRFMTDPTREQLANEVYNQCQVFLQPSSYEGFGFAAVEAMACGAALVTCDNGGSRDYAIHGKTAIVAPRTSEEIAEATAQLLESPAEAARLAAAGRQQASRFDWDHGAEVLERALEAYLADPDRFRAPADEAVDVGPWTADSLLALTAPRVQGDGP